jgi:hypothetical protein
MTEFMRDELNRLVQKIPVTDPCSQEYHVLLRSIEYLDSMGATIEEILAQVFEAQVFEDQVTDDLAAEKLDVKEGAELISAIKARADGKVVPFTAPEFPEAAEAETPAEQEEIKSVPESAESPSEPTTKTYSASDVRKAVVDARLRGVDTAPLFRKYGAEFFQGVPESRYPDLLRDLGVIE